MVIYFINSKELLENLSLVINSKKKTKRYKKKVGYNMYIMQQSAWLVVNPTTVYMVSSLIEQTQ